MYLQDYHLEPNLDAVLIQLIAMIQWNSLKNSLKNVMIQWNENIRMLIEIKLDLFILRRRWKWKLPTQPKILENNKKKTDRVLS